MEMHCVLNIKFVQYELEKVKGSIKFQKIKRYQKRHLTDKVIYHTENRAQEDVLEVLLKMMGVNKWFN